MPRRRDPNLLTGYLCRFCGERIMWGTILRLIRVDPDTPSYMLLESYCHTECLEPLLRPGLALTLHRHWHGGTPMLDDSADVDGQPCAMCGQAIAPEALVRLRVQKPVGPVKRPEFDEQTLPLHFDCLAAISTSRFG
jgi:hypothetical protein